LGTLQALLLGGLCIPLYNLQVRHRRRYEKLADNNRLAMRFLNPPRGRLLDRHGTILAHNKNSFRLVVIASTRQELKSSLKKLVKLINLPLSSCEHLLGHFRSNAHSLMPLVIREGLSWEEVAHLELHLEDLPGICVEADQSRFYPLGEQTAHSVGYVGSPAQREASADRARHLPGRRIGKTGLEKAWEADLGGVAGQTTLEVNASRTVMRTLGHTPPTPGKDLRVTLDSALQTYIASRLKAYETASVVVLDSSGGVRALVSNPSYDPQVFIHGVCPQVWENLRQNPSKPLINRALSGLYAPGSTIKMAVALAALEKGLLTPSTTFSCKGVLTLNNHPFHCWIHGKGTHGAVNCVQALSRSCDVFFYEVARRVGIEALAATFKILGLGEKWLDVFQESNRGLVPTREWKEQRHHRPWTPTDTVLTGIGQGYLLSNPLQLAVMTARLATGRLVEPFFRLPDNPPVLAPCLPFAPQHLDLVRQGMKDVLQEPQGTAYGARIVAPGFQMAGKTGTSQVRRIQLAERARGMTKTAHRPRQEREHALFCGYAPVHAPHYIISLVVEHGGSGSTVAAPLARDILTFAQGLKD
jgi:penicillin-binding protein 2